MTRHLLDHREPASGGKVAAFLKIARASNDERPARVSTSMLRTARKTASGAPVDARLAHFLRIARGRMA